MNASEISQNLADRIEALVYALASGRLVQRAKGQLRIGNKGSIAVELRYPKPGLWADNEQGVGGDALDLIRHMQGCSRRDAYYWACDWLGQPQSAQPPQQATYTPLSGEIWRSLWQECLPTAGTPAEAYLASRSLALPVNAPLMFHPRCPRQNDRLPAMVALMTDPVSGEPCGVHRTFIKPDGSGKADVAPAKMMLGRAGLIRLTPGDEFTTALGVAEGIENALAVMQYVEWRPVWAAGSAGAIARLPVLPGIECLTIFADADDSGAGMKAARDAATAWEAAGREVAVWKPPGGADWLDALTAPGDA